MTKYLIVVDSHDTSRFQIVDAARVDEVAVEIAAARPGCSDPQYFAALQVAGYESDHQDRYYVGAVEKYAWRIFIEIDSCLADGCFSEVEADARHLAEVAAEMGRL